MSTKQQRAYLEEVNSILTEQELMMPESRAHGRAKSAALDRLGQHFSRIGRRIYLASELAVHYPAEKSFVPDVMAVLDVEDPGDADERKAWVVAAEGRGLDLVLEVLCLGDRGKDLVRNVELYARLGIQEYFVYDRPGQAIQGWRLPQSGSVYRSLPLRAGRLCSRVLGLDLAVQGGRLRFYSGAAELPGSEELIGQLGQMVDELEARRAQAEQERAQAEQERAQAEQERAQAEQERSRVIEALRGTVCRILEARSIPLSEQFWATIEAQSDPEVLGRWAVNAALATSAGDVIS